MTYTIEEIKIKVKKVADSFDIEKIQLFGSYYDKNPTDSSDIDLLVKYGKNCKGLARIKFMNELEKHLNKEVDVINMDFKPSFMEEMNLEDEGSIIYVK